MKKKKGDEADVRGERVFKENNLLFILSSKKNS